MLSAPNIRVAVFLLPK